MSRTRSRHRKAATALSAAALVLSFSSLFPTVTYAKLRAAKTEQVAFHVISASRQDISGARVACIGPDGKVLHSGITDKSGDWTVKLKLQQDPRFKKVHKMGTVTAMAVAQGYNEALVFDVPVANQSQPITMEKITSKGQNNPTYSIGNIHRLDVMQMVDRYAKQLKLQKQSPVPGEQGYAPWGPNTAK